MVWLKETEENRAEQGHTSEASFVQRALAFLSGRKGQRLGTTVKLPQVWRPFPAWPGSPQSLSGGKRRLIRCHAGVLLLGSWTVTD